MLSTNLTSSLQKWQITWKLQEKIIFSLKGLLSIMDGEFELIVLFIPWHYYNACALYRYTNI